MKILNVSLLVVAAISLAACNSNSTSGNHVGHDKVAMDKMDHSKSKERAGITDVAVSYSNVDQNAAVVLKESVNQYLQIKEALAGDNASEAAKNANQLLASLAKLDKSFLSAVQKEKYDQLESSLEEHAKQIETSAADINAQRMHFSELSGSIYELVKAFGAGKPVYHVYCSMAKDNEGAMWLSDSRDVRNPYFGKDMLTCGSIEEKIQ